MFDAVAKRYDITNDVLSMGQDRRWRKRVVRLVDPKPGELVLDLAAGSGVWGVALGTIFLGAGLIFLNPSLDIRGVSKAGLTEKGLGVTAQKSPAEGAVDALTSALKDSDAGAAHVATEHAQNFFPFFSIGAFGRRWAISPRLSAATRFSRQIATGLPSTRPRRHAGSQGRSQVRPRMPGKTFDSRLRM